MILTGDSGADDNYGGGRHGEVEGRRGVLFVERGEEIGCCYVFVLFWPL